jgi:DNA-binding transcriptional ArsR family regulator
MKNPSSSDPYDSRRLDRFFKALANNTRRQILRLLDEGERTVGEIVADFPLSQPTISRHLSILRHAQLVDDRRKGQQVRYRLRRRELARRAQQFFDAFTKERVELGRRAERR